MENKHLIYLFFLSLILGGIMLILNFFLTRKLKQSKDNDKLVPYECGFDAFEEARLPFDVHYYVIAILFLFFDLEIAFLFPWAVLITKLEISGIFAGLAFFFLITLGYFYEWYLGLLDI